jgi:hypothetical protein
MPIEYHTYHAGEDEFRLAKKARRVKFEGFEDFHFFMHADSSGKGWRISEATTGTVVTFGRTQKETKASAEDALRRYGVAGTAEAIRHAAETAGRLAPGFSEDDLP